MGGSQSIDKIKIKEVQKNMSPKLRAGVLQSQAQEIRSRNVVDNKMYQNQNTFAKKTPIHTINFKR